MNEVKSLWVLWQRIVAHLARDLLARGPDAPDPTVDTAHGLALVLLTQDLSERACEAIEEDLIVLLWDELWAKLKAGSPLGPVDVLGADLMMHYLNDLGLGWTPRRGPASEAEHRSERAS